MKVASSSPQFSLSENVSFITKLYTEYFQTVMSWFKYVVCEMQIIKYGPSNNTDYWSNIFWWTVWTMFITLVSLKVMVKFQINAVHGPTKQ